MDIERERQIIRRVRDGERDAFAELVVTHQRSVYNLIFRLTGSVQDADDLSQEAFMRAFEALGQFDTSRRFFPWLYTIALNVVRNHHRGRRSPLDGASQITPDFPDNHSGPKPEELMQRKQASEALFNCIQRLPAQQKEAVVLRYYQELSFEEVAEILVINLSTAKMRVYRGLQRLSGWLQAEAADARENK
jgi:RNA polymerase sigma-70 factor (ECF subfamily)